MPGKPGHNRTFSGTGTKAVTGQQNSRRKGGHGRALQQRACRSTCSVSPPDLLLTFAVVCARGVLPGEVLSAEFSMDFSHVCRGTEHRTGSTGCSAHLIPRAQRAAGWKAEQHRAPRAAELQIKPSWPIPASILHFLRGLYSLIEMTQVLGLLPLPPGPRWPGLCQTVSSAQSLFLRGHTP